MALCSLIYLYPGNTQVITITGLQDLVTEQFLDAATVTATLYNEHGIADSVLNNITLSYVTASNGIYQGTVPSGFNAKLGGGYVLKVQAEQSGIVVLLTIPAEVRLRTS